MIGIIVRFVVEVLIEGGKVNSMPKRYISSSGIKEYYGIFS